MITRDQFEAHVRVEAERKHELSPERTTYIATRMEHEWPLVAELLRAKERFDYLTLGGVGMTNGVSPEAGSKDIAAVLTKSQLNISPTKP